MEGEREVPPSQLPLPLAYVQRRPLQTPKPKGHSHQSILMAHSVNVTELIKQRAHVDRATCQQWEAQYNVERKI